MKWRSRCSWGAMVWMVAVASACAFDVTAPIGERADGGFDTPRTDADASIDEVPDGSQPPGTSGTVAVPGTSYDMGCAALSVLGCDPDELPAHTVTVSSFAIDVTEVTQSAYAACMAAGACVKPVCAFHPSERGAHPVVCVDWQQADAYCQWRGQRLPTEAEWELAARGADGRVYPWGNEVDVDCTRANGDRCHDGTLPVGSMPAGASPYGAQDMAGNAFEWVADYYDGAYYALSGGATDPGGPSVGTTRVARGGSFMWSSHHYRSTNRSRDAPSDAFADLGFRCAQ